MRGMRKAAAPSWPKEDLRSSVVMRDIRKFACSLMAKSFWQSDDKGDEDGWLLPNS
jgi:hypothetical protein